MGGGILPGLVASDRLRRNTDQVSTILNSLIGQDILVQTGDRSWTLNLAGVLANLGGPTGTFTASF